MFMAPAALTALLPTPAITVATHIAATSPDGRRCSRATTAAWALATALMPLTVASPLNRGITMFMAPAGSTALLPTPATVATPTAATLPDGRRCSHATTAGKLCRVDQIADENNGAGFRARAFFSSRANFSLFAEPDLDRGGRLRTATKA